MTVRVYLDGNIYDKFSEDEDARSWMLDYVHAGRIEVVATPVVVNELAKSPFGGIPDFFPVSVEPEALVVLGHARLGMARFGKGEVFKAHRGASTQTRDAIIADSADKLAQILVSEDDRCRKRLDQISARCKAWDFKTFRTWLVEGGDARDAV